MSTPLDRPVLAYDGGCGFCERWIERWRAVLDGRVRIAPIEEVGDELGLDTARPARAILFVDEERRVSRGAEAVLRALARAPGKGWMLWLYLHVPLWRPAAEAVYALVARHRAFGSWLTRWTVGPDLTRAGFRGSRRLFVALAGLTYAIAFGSLWVQLQGLYGSDGILPIEAFLERVRVAAGRTPWSELPTLFWLSASDLALHGACAAGLLLSALAACGVAPRACFLALWLLYLSFVSAGQVFLGYQWDALLLESGLLAVLYAPLGPLMRRRNQVPDARAARWLLRWLLFRLVFLSGFVKLASHDPTWADRSALEFHYWTQPLPHALAVTASRLPSWLQHASVVGMLAIELGAPFLLFGPRRLRHFACAAIALLMLLISATGNYGFFTLLTLMLCLAQVDDRALAALVPRRSSRAPDAWPGERPLPASEPRRIAAAVLFVLVLLLTGRVLLGRLGWIERVPAPLEWLARRTEPLSSFNSYGLFALMTTRREEIEIQGSPDGVEWRTYVFPYKPGPIERALVFAGAHMPRLDWQMWFSSLRGWRNDPWTLELMRRLLEGSPSVRRLFEVDPFPDHPPRYLRTLLYSYRFAPREERAASGAWWQRELIGPWAPVFELREGELALAR